MMEVARGVPNACHGLEGHASYRIVPAPVRPGRHHHRVISAVGGGLGVVGQRCGWPPFVRSLVLPDGPRDARELVGESDSRPVVPPLPFDFEGPELYWMGVAGTFGAGEHGPCAVYEEHPEVGIAPLADASEPTVEAGRVFIWCEAEVRGEVSS